MISKELEFNIAIEQRQGMLGNDQPKHVAIDERLTGTPLKWVLSHNINIPGLLPRQH